MSLVASLPSQVAGARRRSVTHGHGRARCDGYLRSRPSVMRRHLCSLGMRLPGSLNRVRCRRDALAMTEWCAILPGAP